MKYLTEYITTQKQLLLKSLNYLEYSYKKIYPLQPTISDLDAESFEAWECFAVRFSRVVEIFLSRYLRACILQTDPGFRGSLRDFIYEAEKLGILHDPEYWMMLRSLYNITAHDSSEEEIELFFQKLKTLCPELLNLKNILCD